MRLESQTDDGEAGQTLTKISGGFWPPWNGISRDTFTRENQPYGSGKEIVSPRTPPLETVHAAVHRTRLGQTTYVRSSRGCDLLMAIEM